MCVAAEVRSHLVTKLSLILRYLLLSNAQLILMTEWTSYMEIMWMLSSEMPVRMATGSNMGANRMEILDSHEMETLHVDEANRIRMETMALATYADVNIISGATASL